MENDSGFCIDCSHKHRGIAKCNYCGCDWSIPKIVLEENNMFKKLWKKIVEWLWK